MPMPRTTCTKVTGAMFGILPSILHDPHTVYAPAQYFRRLSNMARS